MAPEPSAAPRLSRWRGRAGLLLGRSLFAILTLAILLGTMIWGPWVSLALTLLLWFALMRWA
jgi:hypothetical protein